MQPKLHLSKSNVLSRESLNERTAGGNYRAAIQTRDPSFTCPPCDPGLCVKCTRLPKGVDWRQNRIDGMKPLKNLATLLFPADDTALCDSTPPGVLVLVSNPCRCMCNASAFPAEDTVDEKPSVTRRTLIDDEMEASFDHETFLSLAICKFGKPSVARASRDGTWCAHQKPSGHKMWAGWSVGQCLIFSVLTPPHQMITTAFQRHTHANAQAAVGRHVGHTSIAIFRTFVRGGRMVEHAQ